MKRTLKRLLVLTLSLLMLLPVFATCVEAKQANDTPIVYVLGKYAPIYDANEKQVYPLDPPIADTISNRQTLASILAKFQLGEQLGQWDACANEIYDTIAPRYAPLVMNDDGNPQNGTHVHENPLPTKNKAPYWLHDFEFNYDSRLDPYENARLLNSYIKNVLTVTGKDKVNLIGRCLGTTVVATYLTEYGCSRVDTCIFYAAAYNGVYVMDGFFSADFDIEYNRVQYYLKNGKRDEGGNFDTIQSTADGINKLGLFGWFLSSANNGLQQMKSNLFPRLTLAIFGTWPGHWAMISSDAYKKAKETTLADSTKYAGLIKKVDKYQNKVMSVFPQTLEACRQKGMRVAIVCKYNLPLPPLSPNSSMQADGTVELRTMSLGATATNVGEELSSAYIEDVKGYGTIGSFVEDMKDQGKNIYLDSTTNKMLRRSNYLSKDNMVDASTCQYPDYTWFIKNCAHAAYPWDIDLLFLEIFNSPTQYTIYSNSKYPQFVSYDSDTGEIAEVTSPDTGKKEDSTSSSSFFKRIADWIIDFCRKIMEFFGMSR